MKNRKERFVIEFYFNGAWTPWTTSSGLASFKFKSIKSAADQLKEALNESRADSYRYDYLRDKEFRTRKVYIFDDVYTDETQLIEL